MKQMSKISHFRWTLILLALLFFIFVLLQLSYICKPVDNQDQRFVSNEIFSPVLTTLAIQNLFRGTCMSTDLVGARVLYNCPDENVAANAAQMIIVNRDAADARNLRLTSVSGMAAPLNYPKYCLAAEDSKNLRQSDVCVNDRNEYWRPCEVCWCVENCNSPEQITECAIQYESVAFPGQCVGTSDGDTGVIGTDLILRSCDGCGNIPGKADLKITWIERPFDQFQFIRNGSNVYLAAVVEESTLYVNANGTLVSMLSSASQFSIQNRALPTSTEAVSVINEAEEAGREKQYILYHLGGPFEKTTEKLLSCQGEPNAVQRVEYESSSDPFIVFRTSNRNHEYMIKNGIYLIGGPGGIGTNFFVRCGLQIGWGDGERLYFQMLMA